MDEEQSSIDKKLSDIAGQISLLQNDVRAIKRRLVIASAYGVLKLILIIAPLLLGLWYLQGISDQGIASFLNQIGQ